MYTEIITEIVNHLHKNAVEVVHSKVRFGPTKHLTQKFGKKCFLSFQE